VSEIARLTVKAARGDAPALKGLLEKPVSAVEKARASAAAVEALSEADKLLAEGCGKLPEAKLHVRVASSRARASVASRLLQPAQYTPIASLEEAAGAAAHTSLSLLY
jgi:hypothetical protein